MAYPSELHHPRVDYDGKQLTEWVIAEAEESIARNQCLPGKVYPDDVARLLAADDSRACTAQRWIVDGGWM